MPHKHKRKRDDDKDQFDLPPSRRPKSLPTYSNEPSRKQNDARKKTKSNPNTNRINHDDTPRAFARMMALQRNGNRLRSYLNSGEDSFKGKKGKDRRKSNPNDDSQTSHSTHTQSQNPSQPESSSERVTEHGQSVRDEHPKIKPGERLSDFSLRVDQSLPLNFPKHRPVTKSTSGRDPLGMRGQTTKHNRKLQRMQQEWREEERRRRLKREEEGESEEEELEDEELLWDSVRAARSERKGRRRKEKSTTARVGMEDPWAILEERGKETRQKNLQDVVQGPPQELKRLALNGAMVNKFKISQED